jgi:hypothetical protein
MENKQRQLELKVIECESRIKYLESIIREQEIELFKFRCLSYSKKPINKIGEIKEALIYLKSKKYKTIKDRESIDILENVLTNIK